jgi:hypothetical protein
MTHFLQHYSSSAQNNSNLNFGAQNLVSHGCNLVVSNEGRHATAMGAVVLPWHCSACVGF